MTHWKHNNDAASTIDLELVLVKKEMADGCMKASLFTATSSNGPKCVAWNGMVWPSMQLLNEINQN
jgi:hypothetical protein